MNDMLQWPMDTTLEDVVTQLNSTLAAVTPKDWNYSRISLSVRALDSLSSPYVLWLEVVDPVTKSGRADLKALANEVRWGEHHSSELGILEIVSLRINKALLESEAIHLPQTKRIIVRIVKKDVLAKQGVRAAVWYEVNEVVGEDFDNR